jgi:putative transposase
MTVVIPKPNHPWRIPGDFSSGKPKHNKYTWWRYLTHYHQLSPEACGRLEWIIFYYTVGKKNARFTANYFGIARKTFHHWKKRFNPKQISSLEEKSRAPIHKRVWQVTEVQEARIIALRKQHLRYGKRKLKLLYEQIHGESITAWKIERVVRKHQLYREHKKHYSHRLERKTKVRIHQLAKPVNAGRLWHTDSVIIYWYGQRRVIFTALEHQTKLGYARVYTTHSSRNAKDFLERLIYLSEGKIQIIHSDNGSEFAGAFETACTQLNIAQVYSRVRTPKDNAALERFNRTLQEEWLDLSEVGLDEIVEANTDLTQWLIEYNNHRPHASLDYLTPIQYAQQHYFNVLPMWSADTDPCTSLL